MEKNLVTEIMAFRDERNWAQFHNPKDLAISLSLEAAELLENFQWSSSEEAVATKREAIQDELADILLYCVMFSETLGIDIETAVRGKLEKNRAKYPVEKAFGKKLKYTEY